MKRVSLRATLLALLTLGVAPTAAVAHTGLSEPSGIMHGFLHPLTGVDHLLAMILVGIFAYQLGRNALWLVPFAFVSLMAVGGLAGVAAIPLPFIEIAIALSVVVLGLAVAFGVKAPVAIAMTVVGLFAVFHGHAHGSEMPMEVSSAAYGVGFMLATALLHAIGIAFGVLLGAIGQAYGTVVCRVAGGLAAAVGVVLLVA